MNFLITTFFETIADPIPVVPSRSIRLENPSEGAEALHIQRLFERAVSLDGSQASMIPGIAIHSDWPAEAHDARMKARGAASDGGIPAAEGNEFLKQAAQAAAKEVVVVRFDDEGSLDVLEEHRRSAPPNSVMFLPDEHPLLNRAKEAANLCGLISLLICDVADQWELGSTFVMSDDVSWSVGLGESIGRSLVSQSIARVRSDDTPTTGFAFTDLRHYCDELVAVGTLVSERLCDFDPDDPLLYAAELLHLASRSSDTRTGLVNLVGLLELLLTRNPDSSRFNVEDSLTKQFVLKLGVLLYDEDPSRDMDWTRVALRDLYSIRSAIAHGNFSGLGKMLSKSRFAQPDDEDDDGFSPRQLRLDAACQFAYECVRCAFRAALTDIELVRFLKQG